MSILNPFVLQKESGSNISRIAFVLEDQRMLFDAVYTMDGMPKSKLNGVFPLKSIFSLYVKFEVVLRGEQSKFNFPFSVSLSDNAVDLVLFFERMQKVGNEDNTYRLRVERYSTGNFVQLDLNPEEAFGLRTFFKLALY